MPVDKLGSAVQASSPPWCDGRWLWDCFTDNFFYLPSLHFCIPDLDQGFQGYIQWIRFALLPFLNGPLDTEAHDEQNTLLRHSLFDICSLSAWRIRFFRISSLIKLAVSQNRDSADL